MKRRMILTIIALLLLLSFAPATASAGTINSNVKTIDTLTATIGSELGSTPKTYSLNDVDKNTESLYFGMDEMTDFEVDEFEQIWLACIVPNGWEYKNMNSPITGDELYDLWRTFTVKTLGFSESELDSNCWNYIRSTITNHDTIERGTVGMLYVFAFLKDQLKLADYASFDACTACDTARSSLYCPFISEYLDESFNEYREENGGCVWGSELCAITKDLISGAPMFDVDKNGFARLTDNITYKEALQMLYRFSRSNRWVDTAEGYVSLEEAARTISLTPEQQAMAQGMPLPTYENLPDWQGLWMTGDRAIFDEKYQMEEDYRTLAECGFNHLRYTLFVKDLLSEDHTQFNAQILKALDDAIQYAIKYGIHINLNIKVGSATETDVLVNWSQYSYLKEMYRVLATRYQEVPSNALSFYLFFEPSVNDTYAASDSDSFITDARYAQICYELADVIWSADDDRFITVDGIFFGSEPSIALAEEGVRRTSEESTGLGTIAQSFHYFSTSSTWTNGFYGEAPSLADWPLPYVQNVLMAGGQTITVNANSDGFPAGTMVKVTQRECNAPASKLNLNTDCKIDYDGSSVTFTLNGNADSLVLSSSADNYSYNDIDTIWITYPFDAKEQIPIFGYFTDRSSTRIYSDEVGDYTNFNTNVLPTLLNGMPLDSMLGTLVRRFETKQIVVITCGGDSLNMSDWASVSTTVNIADDYGYNSDSAWSFGADYTHKFLDGWLDYQNTYHTETMITEFGANNGSTEDVVTSIIAEYLGVIKEHRIAWSGYAAIRNKNGSLFDDFMYNGNYGKLRTHWYDIPLMKVLKDNMTTFDVSEVSKQTYTGSEIKPKLTVSFEGTTLIEGTDYTLSYFDNTGYGCAVIRILGIGGYAGMSRTICFTISPFDEYTTPASYMVNASANNSAYGNVSGGGAYNGGATVMLRATPNTGYHFVCWTEGGTEISKNANYSFTAAADRTFRAVFAINSYTVNASANNVSYGTVTGGDTYNHGAKATLKATPASGCYFIGWLENGAMVSTNPSYAIIVTGSMSFTAEFSVLTPLSISCTKADASVYGGANGSVTISASGGNSGSYEYSINDGSSWQSSNAFGGLGAATYTAAVRDAAYPSNIATCSVSIGQPTNIGNVPANKVPSTANAGTAVTVVPPAAPKGATITSVSYSTTNPSVATVDAKGNVTFLAGGKTTIVTTVVTQTTDKTGKVKIKTTTVKKTITVKQPVASVALSMNSATVARKANVKLIPSIAPGTASNKKLKWTSSNPKIASVSSSGVVTGKAGGTAIITCTAKDGSGVSASCTVTVTPIYPTGVKTSKAALAIKIGKAASLKATVMPKTTDFKTVTWASSNPAVATVDDKGKVTALSSGTAVITATTSNGISASCTVVVQ